MPSVLLATKENDTQLVLDTIQEHISNVIRILGTITTLWKTIDKYANDNQKALNWKEYRLYDTIEVCTQEAQRIANSIQSIPAEAILGRESLMLLEQRYGLWQPYISDDSDEEDWREETGPHQCCETDEDEIQSESEEDIEIIE